MSHLGREPFDRYVSTHLSHFAPRDASWYRRRGRYFEHRLAAFLPSRRDAQILDAACGGGECVAALRALGYAAVRGIDISDQQIAAGRAVGVEGLEKAEAVSYLEARSDELDCIVASHVLEHLGPSDLLAFLRAGVGALRARGRLIVLTPNAGSPLGLPNTFGDLTHLQHFTATSLAQAAELAGLRVVHLVGVQPDPREGRLRAVLWRMVRPFLATALGSDSRYGAVVEPELIGVFEPAAAE